MKIIPLYFIVLFLCGIPLHKIVAQRAAATEIRAAWLTTNWNLDWPRAGSSPDEQKAQMREILDSLKRANFNTVLFQARVRGDVFYQSNIEPWSPYFYRSDIIGDQNAPYDPLLFVINECHRRGMECHAWLVTFPVGSQKLVKNRKNNSIAFRRPDICKLHLRDWFLDPGNPEARAYFVSLVNELVSKYDIDGIHLDYIRYPEASTKFPDKDTYRKYGNGKSLADWRRDNITALVGDVYRKVKSIKPWVQVSCSPVGRYRPLNYTNNKWTAYESVAQDAGRWLREGIMDAVYPMLYYNDPEFKDYIKDWISESNGRFIVPGLGIYRMQKSEGDWEPEEICRQMNDAEECSISGLAYYRAGNIIDNTKGIYSMLKGDYFYPAKLPPMAWLDSEAPEPPLDMQVYRNKKGLVAIEWQPSDEEEEQTYTVYLSDSDDIDVDKADGIIATGIRGRKIYVDIPDSETGMYFSVTASDPYHNESKPCCPVFFIPSTTLEK
jgi:uncharacterized lipoprotein YddW (UPF0748 family)